MKKDTKQVVMVASVTAGLVALSAASYFMFGDDGKKHRKQIKGWTLKMKGEVLEKLEKIKDINPKIYNQIIDDVSVKYGKLKHISKDEISQIVFDLKKHWNAIEKDTKLQGKVIDKKVKSAKKVVIKDIK